jgi:hypothetical protein
MHIVLILLIVFAIMLWVARGRKTTRACRWRAEKSGDRGALRKYRCAACGEEAFTSTKGPPNTCKAGKGSGSL